MGKRVVHPVGPPARYRRGIPDIFIPPTQNGNAGVQRGRNENSGMTTRGTTGGGDSFTPSKEVAPLSVLAFYLRVVRQPHFPLHNHFRSPRLLRRTLEQVMPNPAFCSS